MAIFDYIVYASYKFSINKLGRTHDEALFSAIGTVCLYTTFAIVGIIVLAGIIVDNPLTQIIINLKQIVILPLGIVVFILFYIRYYKIIGDINLKIVERDKNQSNKYMRKLVRFIFFAVPILTFIFYRIYLGDWNNKF